jgi:membrane protein YqaA with SNARE-associated domain
MFRPLYDWVMRQADSRHAQPAMAAVSFAESSFFPIPPDAMLAPMILARPERAYWYAFICTAASVLGGLFGYAIGYFLEPLGVWLLSVLGHPEGQAQFEHWFAQWGLWVILIKGVTIIPYKVVTIASGLAAFDLFTFIWASVVTRGARFFITAALIRQFGPAIREEVEKRLTLYMTLGLVALIGSLVVIRFVL